MKAEPLNKAIYETAQQLGVEKIVLHFSGGNDEGYLNVSLKPDTCWPSSIYQEVEDWAWKVYRYSGGGDGTEYGDDITYDLKEGKVSTREWYTEPKYNEPEDDDLIVE